MTDSAEKFAVAVLASGQSRRFGTADKLAAPFKSKMLGLHICETLSRRDFNSSWVISSQTNHPCEQRWQDAGFEIVVNNQAATGMGSSLALAARLAGQTDAAGLLICLADMPLITMDHIDKLLLRFNDDPGNRPVASSNGKVAMPPAIFDRTFWPELERASGEQGARVLLADARLVTASERELSDIDTPDGLEKLEMSGPRT